jgi:circadian clock protein KaiC
VIVIDSSKALHDVVDAARLRRAIYDLASKVAHSKAVLVLVGEYTPAETRSEPEFAVADGIVMLENEARGPIDRRWLRVLKMRGSELSPGQHSFSLGGSGFEVYPRLETTLPDEYETLAGRASVDIPALDELMGGGIPIGDSALVLGPSGVGKTLLALHFVAAGLERGERCLYLSFQETAEELLMKAASTGRDWEPFLGDRLIVRHVAPVEVDLDQVAAIVRRELASGDVKRVVVDSLAELAFAARETERLPGYVWALGGFIRSAGGTTLFTNEMAALGRASDLGGLSFVFNDVLFLRYVEIESELRRALNVLKMRRSGHDHGVVEYTIGPGGMSIVGPMKGLSGVLGWSALRSDDTGDDG